MNYLRGHHLICLHFFTGEGYDEKYIRNLKRVLKMAHRDGIIVQKNTDDVCAACLHFAEKKCNYNKNSDEKIKCLDKLALKLLSIEIGSKVNWYDLKNKVSKIFTEWRDGACNKCEWLSTCESTELWKRLNSP